MQRLLLQLRALFQRKAATAQLYDELHFHLDQQIAENIAAGMNADEARKAALRAFGNPVVLREQARATWAGQWLELFLQDIRRSLRTLARSPGFCAIAVMVIGLGIGANVALFTVVRSILLKPLPFDHADQLVRIYEADALAHLQDNVVAGGTFADWQTHSRSFEQMALLQRRDVNLAGSENELPEVVTDGNISHGLFPVLGVQPALGRCLSPEMTRRKPALPLFFHGIYGSAATAATQRCSEKQSLLMQVLTPSSAYFRHGSTILTAACNCGRRSITTVHVH